jgi:hypothetical protein
MVTAQLNNDYLETTMFFLESQDYVYPLPQVLKEPAGMNVYCPLEVDTEYTHPPYDINNPSKVVSTDISVQCRSINETTGKIYALNDIAHCARHRVVTTEFIGIDYLRDNGYDVEMERLESWATTTDYPFIQFDLYAFFAVAELFRVFSGKFEGDINRLCLHPDKQGIEQGRRLRTFHHSKGRYYNWVEMPWIVTLDNQKYRLRLSIYDCAAIHGIASYKDFCKNSGVELPYKDNFTSDEKSRMLEMYMTRGDDFDNYALGDLYNHNALMGNAENFLKIYQSLGIEDYYSPPRLTIGSTVSKIIEGSIKKLFTPMAIDKLFTKSSGKNSGKSTVITTFCKYGTADWLKRKTTTTGALNAKVDGGRCRNNRPLDTVIKGVICDIDISGCYGEGLRVQLYPLGIPMLIDYPVNSEHNEYQTLRQFLKRYQEELVPGLWQARVTGKDGHTFKYKQDYLISWQCPKDISKIPTDSEMESTDDWWDVDNIGTTKIFNHDIQHAIITHDFIQWLDNIASPRQRKELLDNLVVETAMYYPASERVDSTDKLVDTHLAHKGKNRTYATKHQDITRKVAIEEMCHKWYGVNLGELMVSKLLLERKKHPKKTPFNELYKLCINTVYGDMVSPFFTVGNVVVGNNITARARALAWYMEKGFNGVQSITDGCAFDVNRVLYPRGDCSITGEMSTNLYAQRLIDHHTFKPLAQYGLCSDPSVHPCSDSVHPCNAESSQSDDVAISNPYSLVTGEDGNVCLSVATKPITTLALADAIEWINSAAMKHLQALFPVVDVLHQPTTSVLGKERVGQFEFEAKGFYDSGVFHGSANYALIMRDNFKVAMRSYSKRGHKMFELTDKIEMVSENDNPASNFLKSLLTPQIVARSPVHIGERILKVSDYRRHYGRWENSLAFPGCTIEVPGMLREFSISQFTFNTIVQWKTWMKEYERLLRQYGQSYEMFFLNADGTLNYQAMIEAVDGKIRANKMNFFDGVSKRESNMYRSQMVHIHHQCLLEVRDKLSQRYGNAVILDDGDVSDYGDFPDE